MQSRFTNSRAFVRSAMLCSAAVLAIFPVAAMAQGAPAADAADGDAIVVTGSRPIAESEAAALQVQKNSDSLVSVVSSDAAGRLPDQNIAQATGRLPGVAVERDQGQARYISIRGAPNYWTTLSFDGINVVSPEGRDARFDSIPSAIAAQIIVSKAVTPDMPGETVSGNVNVITRSAFDYEGFHFAGKAGYGIAELGNRPQYEGSAVVSTRVPAGEGEIGVLVSGSYYQRAMITDNFETDYERVSQDQRPDSLSRFWAQETENKLYRLTRRNWSLSGRLDWKPNADNSISLRSIYTTFTDDEMRDNFRFDLDDRQGDLVANTAACGTAVNPTPTTTGYADVCIGNTPFQGTIYGIDIRQRSTLRAFEQSIFTNTIEGTHEFGDGWKFNWLGNYTESKDDRSVVGETTWDSPSTRNLRPTVAYDFTDPNLARLRLFTTVQLSSPTRYEAGTPLTDIDSFTKPLASMNILDAVDTTKAYTAKFVVSRETEFLGGDAVLKAGFQFDQRTKTVDESSMALNNATQFATIGISTSYNGFSLDTPFKGKIPMGYTFRYFDADKMRAASDAARTNFTFTPALGNIYDVQEEVMAAYLMGTVRYDWGSAVGGARIERVKNSGTAVATVGTVTGPVTAENTGTLVFPSMHLNFDVDTDKKLRIGFTSGAARADYDQLRPNVVVDDSNQRISGGNPGVKPERSYGVDAYYEYYVQPQGYFMIGAFYKKVEDVLYTSRSTFGSNALDSNGVDRSAYAFSGITNGGSGSVRGVEAAAQFQLEPYVSDLVLPDWMGGFGITANATYNDSEVTKPAILDAAGATISPERKVPLPGTSEVVYNVGAYYEKYGLSVRLQYQNRTAWADGFADNLDSAGDTYWAKDDELDFSARYEISNGIEIYFDAANLLNNPGRRYSDPSNILNAQGVSTPFTNRYTIEWERFGRRYSGGIRVNF
ncbi:TonB-dependent receptor [Sphingorhabdus sp.]|uniref:TonB-dependent receptor n=1 Tax=Sphingorhabdus sp. TaxID=1902408 RepID=UPI002FDF0144